MNKVLETTRLVLRELEPEPDAAFVCSLLNSPKFIKHIGDRGVRTLEDAAKFIETRYQRSYRDNGYGLYALDLKATAESVGMCGFVRRDTLPGPDLGFAFLPEHERQGYGYESASAIMEYGRDILGFAHVLAITSLDNDASIALLRKLGFTFQDLIDQGAERLNLFSVDL